MTSWQILSRTRYKMPCVPLQTISVSPPPPTPPNLPPTPVYLVHTPTLNPCHNPQLQCVPVRLVPLFLASLVGVGEMQSPAARTPSCPTDSVGHRSHIPVYSPLSSDSHAPTSDKPVETSVSAATGSCGPGASNKTVKNSAEATHLPSGPGTGNNSSCSRAPHRKDTTLSATQCQNSEGAQSCPLNDDGFLPTGQGGKAEQSREGASQ